MKFLYKIPLFLIVGLCLFFIQTYSMEQPPHQPGRSARNGTSALHNAILRDDRVAVAFLSNTHGNVIFQDELPLHFAVRRGQTEIVGLLLDGGVAVNKANNRETPLHIAARMGHQAIVELLIAHGADLTIARSDGRTALDLAIKNGHQPVVSFLIEAKKTRGETLEWKAYLNMAKVGKHTAIYHWLENTQKSAQSTSLGKRKEYPKQAAPQPQDMRQRREPVMKAPIIVVSQPSPNYSALSHEEQSRLWFQTHLLDIIYRGDIDGLRLAQHLGVNMNITYTNNKTALEIAAHHQNQSIAQEMVRIILPVSTIPNPLDSVSRQTLDQVMHQMGRVGIARLITDELIRREEVPTLLSQAPFFNGHTT
jgi:hypothetical protein